jgi:hypothetical protein
VDYTSPIVIVSLVFLSIILAALVGIFMNSCHEKSLFVFRELDLRLITGGDVKSHIGGIIVLFWFLWFVSTAGALIFSFIFFNERIDITETYDAHASKFLDSGISIHLKIYSSMLEIE